jgi:hypothetical protein
LKSTLRPAVPRTALGVARRTRYSRPTVADAFDPQAMTRRFRERAAAVRRRGVPPVEGPERRMFVEQAERDYMDFALLGDAEATLADGVLTLRIDLRPPEERTDD